MNASTSGRCRRRWATGVAVQNQSGKRESNPPREAHETLLEPLQSIPQSGRQESNLPLTAYQAVASPLSPRPEEAPCTGIEPVFPGRQPGRCTPASSQGVRVSGGSRTRLSDAAGRCLGCSATDTQARTEGVEPSASRLELDCSPGSTPLSNSGRDRTRTCKGFSPRPASNRVPSCLLARPSLSSCPGRARTCIRLGNGQPHHRCATGQ